MAFLQRYSYYIENGVPDKMIADPPERLWQALRVGVPENLMKNWNQLAQDLLQQINEDYRGAIKKAIG